LVTRSDDEVIKPVPPTVGTNSPLGAGVLGRPLSCWPGGQGLFRGQAGSGLKGLDTQVQPDIMSQLGTSRLSYLFAELPADPVGEELVGHDDSQSLFIIGQFKSRGAVKPHGKPAWAE